MAERSSAQPKSILKTSIPNTHAATSTIAKEQQPAAASQKKPEPNPRHLAIALHHAHQIQARKDTEALILDRIETLQTLPLPTSAAASASSPSPADVSTVKSALRPFQPADYDNLILERNIDGNCGYVLCPNEHRKEDPKSKYRVVWGEKGSGSGGRGREMKVVPKEKLEMWCSEECAERAMYLRVQLSEKPAWERHETVEIMLLEEARDKKNQQQAEQSKGKGKEKAVEEDTELVTDKMKEMDIGVSDGSSTSYNPATEGQRERQSKSAERREIESQNLALERGSTSARPDLAASGLEIVEKNPDANTVTAPTLSAEDSQGGAIEGYRPKGKAAVRAHDGMAQYEDEEEDDEEGDYAEDLLPHI